MSLIVETGIGVYGANGYVPISFVTNYLTLRNRVAENLWSTSTVAVQEAAIIAATDYLDKRFSHKFKGLPLSSFSVTFAEGSVSFAGLPSNDDTLTLGDTIYTFVTSLSGAPNEVLIGSTATLTATNFADAVMALPAAAGVTYGLATVANRHSTAIAAAGVVALVALAPGASGAYTVLSEAATNVTVSPFVGGLDGGIQPLSWPRQYVYDDRGNAIVGIPDKIKQATSEYAVRALNSALFRDPTSDDFGGPVTSRREKVGPIEEEYDYASNMTISRFPAADRLLYPFLVNGGRGGVIRD